MDKLKFITRFPCLIEFVPNKYTGIWHSKDESVGIQLSCPAFPSSSGYHLDLIKGNEIVEFSSENNHTNVFDLMEEVELKLQKTTSESKHNQDIATYQSIFKQLKDLGEEYSYKLSKDYKTVSFPEIPDHPGHFMELHYDQQRQAFHVQRHSLPNKCGKIMGRSISEFLEAFKSELTILDEFYGNLSDIDELCFVIAPAPVTTKDLYRIFKFNEKVFLKITLNPYIPSNVQLNFIGPLEEVESLRRIYCQKIDEWDVEIGAYKNLLLMFDLLYFPYRPDCKTHLAENKQCSICFEFNLDNTYPIITCFNPNCEVIFHSICLQKWFETLTDTKTFCTVTSGLCPYCKQKLTMYLDICEVTGEENN